MTEDQRALVLGIAAISQFLDPDALASRTASAPAEVAELLLPAVETELDEHGVLRWMLRSARRREILERATPGMVRPWLDAVDGDPATAVEAVVRRWLRGEIDLEREAGASHDAVQLAASWLRNCAWLKPAPETAVQVLERSALRARLEDCAGPKFVNRDQDRRWLTETLAGPARAAVIEAGGGMGKSALLAQWLLDQYALDPRFVAIVLDFDEPALSCSNLDSLFAEIARQVALQVPAVDGFYRELRGQLADARWRHAVAVRGIERSLDDSRGASVVLSMFVALLNEVARVVVVLDTFERALRGPRSACENAIAILRSAVRQPGAALLVTGRGPIVLDALAGVPRRELAALDEADALKLLGDRGVNPDRARRIVERVPASPLTLRLAARYVARLGAAALDDSTLDRAIASSQINGYLHARVLAHLPSLRLAAVARVALLLRTLTPERLHQIVGPLVEPPIASIQEARGLFRELASVSDLASNVDGTGMRLELRLEVFEDLTRLLHAEDPALAVKLHRCAAEVLGSSASLEDQDDREYHLRAIAALAGDRDAVRSPVSTLTLRELRARVPELLRSGRHAQALDLVAGSRGAQVDAGLLVLGARAAQRLSQVEHCEELARRAVAVASTALPRAQAAMLLAWVADQHGQPQAARRERCAARQELDRVAPGDTSLPDRAEIVAALATDDRPWAAAELRRMFASPEDRAALVSADIDLIRQVCALIGTRDMLAFAADVKAFEHTARVDFTHVERVLERHPETIARLLSGNPPVLASWLEDQQRSRSLGTALSYIILDAGADHELCVALAELLDQMRASPVTGSVARPIDAQARAQGLADLAEALHTKFADLRPTFEAVRKDTFRIGEKASQVQIHNSILLVDKMRLGDRLVAQLQERGFDREAGLATALFATGEWGKKGIPR